MLQIENFRQKLVESLEAQKDDLKKKYGTITELAELCRDTQQDVDHPDIRDKVLTIIPEEKIADFRGMNGEQLTAMAESFRGQFRGVDDAIMTINNTNP